MSYESASVLPKGLHNSVPCYYFAVERDTGTLSTFGGLKDDVDGDMEMRTAAREMWEESNGVFGDPKSIFEILRNWPINGAKRIDNKTAKHVCYIAPFESLNENVIENFRKTGWNSEIKDIVAIPREKLKTAVDKKQWSMDGYQIRHCVRSTLMQARQQRAL